MIPRAGSAYTYGYVALGEMIGWFIGWDLLLEYIAIVAVVAIGISGYFDAFLSGIGIHMPIWMTSTADEGQGRHRQHSRRSSSACSSPGSCPAAPRPSAGSSSWPWPSRSF